MIEKFLNLFLSSLPTAYDFVKVQLPAFQDRHALLGMGN